MAQKKITELQQIAAMTDGSSIPVDNGIQTYRVTGTQLKTYFAPIYIPPTIQRFTSGSGTYYRTRAFVVSNANATVGATYTHNSVTWTVVRTVASSNLVYLYGNGTPLSSGTLTKASGTGDSSIAFTEYRNSIYIEGEMCGGGGGGGGAGASGSGGGAGGNTTFGSNLNAVGGGGGGGGGGAVGAGGTPTVSATTGQIIVTQLKGGEGAYSGRALSTGDSTPTGQGGTNPFGGSNGVSNCGAGGYGGANNGLASSTSAYGGSGGGAGGYLKFILADAALATSFAYAVGAAGSGGSGSGTGQNNGATGSEGVIIIKEFFQ